MGDMDRELGLRGGMDSRTLDAGYRDRLLMMDELEETAEAIRAQASGFDDVPDDQVRRLETALRTLRSGLGAERMR